MRISVSPSSLARQLPELRLLIIQTYEDDLKIEGREVLSGGELAPMEEEFLILKEFPEFAEIFSKKELMILSMTFGISLHYADIRKVLSSGTSNVVHVHIKNIRKKIKKHKIPIEIKMIRNLGYVITKKV